MTHTRARNCELNVKSIYIPLASRVDFNEIYLVMYACIPHANFVGIQVFIYVIYISIKIILLNRIRGGKKEKLKQE